MNDDTLTVGQWLCVGVFEDFEAPLQTCQHMFFFTGFHISRELVINGLDYD